MAKTLSVFNALGGPGGSPDIAVALPWLLGHNPCFVPG